MKKAIYCFTLSLYFQYSSVQTSINIINSDTTRLIQQKRKYHYIIYDRQSGKYGSLINTPLSELRPTIPADGNLLFFILYDPYNTNLIPFKLDIWFTM
jgi:hypothetical protein